MTLDPVKAPDEPEYLEISFERGRPVALDGREFDSVTLVERLNAAGGRHANVGRYPGSCRPRPPSQLKSQ